MEFNYEQAFDYLLTVSYTRGMSQAQLCEGICDSSNFSKICSGKRKVNADLILQLALKLNISLDDLNLYASLQEPDTYIKLLKQLKQLRAHEDFHAIHELYKSLPKLSNSKYEQLLLWMQAIIELFISFNPLYAIDICKKAIHQTQPDFSFEQMNLSFLNEIELYILYELIYAYLGYEEIYNQPAQYQFDYPITLSTAIIEELSIRPIHKELNLFPQFCSLLAMIYGVLQNKEQLYQIAYKGIHYCQTNLEFSQIPNLYISLIVYEQLCNRPDQAIQYFYETLYLYRLQNKPPVFYRNLSYFILKQKLQVDYDRVNELLPKPLLKSSS